MKFDNNYPKPSNLFRKRYETSYVVQNNTEELLIAEILKLFPNANKKTEFMVNTYFEQILKFQPEKSYIVRFRQRGKLKTDTKKIITPKKWRLKGPGTIEVKIRNLTKHDSVNKSGTFLPDQNGKDILELLKIIRNSPDNSDRVKTFLENANKDQAQATGKKNLYQIDASEFTKIADNLSLFATRVNIRHSFETQLPEECRITLETHPTFYAYPIEHKTHEKSLVKDNYEAYLTEKAERSKIGIKTTSKKYNLIVYKSLKKLIDDLKVPENKYTSKPYYKMIESVSFKAGTLINEAPTRELEIKANIPEKLDIKETLTKLRNILLSKTDPQYRLFLTEPHIGARDYAEKNRTIFGWQDSDGKWHEIATLIRMTKRGKKEYQFSGVLKLKTNSTNKAYGVLNREVSHKYLTKLPAEKQLLTKLRADINGNTVVVGTCKKTKYRIYVQDKDGRNFCVSLDSTYVSETKTMQQLEIEYVHTVIIGSTRSLVSLEEACRQCLIYFEDLLNTLGIKTKETTMRKIDFLAASALS